MKSKKKTSTKRPAKSKSRTAKATTKKSSGKRAKTATASVKSSKKKPAQKNAATRSTTGHRRASVSTEKDIQREIRNKTRVDAAKLSGRQAGDLRGLSRAQAADSESVDELVEEGNVFEAGAVAGVERADDADEQEVHTREFPEDDVPEEYQDQD